ncbi:hypothetical protein RchiOBHm_Chr5g0025001 [Rosa chinensis]|uniref:Uncharacterized protein n=1 Tax=Rosa chinensis TaxID=74649 RepID=A0A2P6Q8G6_ROSCH|nr:hypothetical protein RchiOBHm_Chr5g0025001 [Rosa chinensis]
MFICFSIFVQCCFRSKFCTKFEVFKLMNKLRYEKEKYNATLVAACLIATTLYIYLLEPYPLNIFVSSL